MDTIRRAISTVVALAVTACAPGGAPSANDTTPSDLAGTNEVPAASPTPAPPESPEQSQPPRHNPCDVGDFGDLPVGATCWTEPNALAALAADTTPVRILYTIPAEGWSAFIGPYKDVREGEGLQ